MLKADVPRRYSIAIAIPALLAGLAYSQATYKATEQTLDQTPVEQPLPYSHKVHVGLGLKCRECHTIPEPGFAATYPSEEKCMACHSAIKADSPHIQKLKEFNDSGKPVPWVKIYKVPDFVWFAHASHVEDSAIGCETCHGPVGQREVLFKEKQTSMVSCMECHAKTGAPNDCDFCHDPG